MRTTTKTNSTVDELGTRAAEVAMNGAADYLRQSGLATLKTLPDAEVEALCSELRKETIAALPGALKDAEDAIKAHMSGFASATFEASIKLAGIRAAKTWFAARKGA